MSSLLSFFNKLLPFATPGTPLVQDLLHLIVICTALYFAPQIQDRIQRQRNAQQVENGEPTNGQPFEPNTPTNGNDNAGEDPIEEADHPAAAPDIPMNNDPAPDHFNNFDDPQPGPADPNIPPPGAGAAAAAAQGRNIGAKKAKSLARRDQRRAYNEFMRNQGEAQRAREAEGAEAREKAQEAERERRRVAELALETKKAREREKRRADELRAREEENARRERVVATVKRELEERGMCNLFDVGRGVKGERGGGDVDEVWVENILRAGGVLGKGEGGAVTMVTSTGWVVRVGAEDMAGVYAELASANTGSVGRDGVVSYEDLGVALEKLLRAR